LGILEDHGNKHIFEIRIPLKYLPVSWCKFHRETIGDGWW